MLLFLLERDFFFGVGRYLVWVEYGMGVSGIGGRGGTGVVWGSDAIAACELDFRGMMLPRTSVD
jgi:hypothetical protein